MQAALSFVPAPLPLVAPTKNLASPLKPVSSPKISLFKPIKATADAVPSETSEVDYKSMANSVFPAEACETIGGEACDVEMYPETKIKGELKTKMPKAASEKVEREYLDYNSSKTVFPGEACDDLGGEFCEPEYQKECTRISVLYSQYMSRDKLFTLRTTNWISIIIFHSTC